MRNEFGSGRSKTVRRLWIAVVVLALLSPLGLILPARFGAGSAWGEWSAEEIRKLIGYVPTRLGGMSGLWKAPLQDYSAPGHENAGLRALSGYYILSALIGVVVVVAASIILGKLLSRKDKNGPA